MSGGSYSYAYMDIEDLANTIARNVQTPERIAFAEHLKKVAKAMHDIEWVDSGDYGQGGENEAIMLVVTKKDVIDSAVARARETMETLAHLIDSFSG